MIPARKLDPLEISRRVAGEITPGMVVAVEPDFAPGIKESTPANLGAWFLNNDGTLNGIPVTAADAAAITRGGYVSMAVLNAAQVDASGCFAGVSGAGQPGNAVDLAANAGRVVAILLTTDHNRRVALVNQLNLPPDGINCVDLVVSDVGVIRIQEGRFILQEVAPGWTIEGVESVIGAKLSASPSLREMDFTPHPGQPPSKVYSDGLSALADLSDGATVFIDGFGGPGGMAHYLLVAVRDTGKKNLTIVSNTAGIARVVSFGTPPGRTAIDHSILIENGQVAKAIASFPVSPSVSRPSEFELAYRRGEVDLELVPQGTLAERLRAGGAGVLAFYTPTGAGTLISEGKEQREFDGRPYILEYGLRADFAVIRAHKADTSGNLVYRGTSRNFNAVMAPSARITIAEVDEIVEPCQLDPEEIVTPGVFVQRIVRRPDGFTGYD